MVRSMGKSQGTPLLAAGGNGSAFPAYGCVKPRLAFSLESPLDESGGQAREIKLKSFPSEAPGRFAGGGKKRALRDITGFDAPASLPQGIPLSTAPRGNGEGCGFGNKLCARLYLSNAGALEREEVSGMWWSRNGAERMLIVRRCVLADTFDELWAVA